MISVILAILSVSASAQEEPVQYGADISFPTHRIPVSTNYPWLPHNVDPANNPRPEEYIDMPIQPLGDKNEFYVEYLNGCRQFYKDDGDACDQSEYDRIERNRRQPQSMQVR